MRGDDRPAAGPVAGPAEPVYTEDVWRMYYHTPHDPDWTANSYRSLGTIGTAGEFWALHDAIGDALRGGMFFLMRDNVFPCWDDPANIGGGAISFRLARDAAEGLWLGLCRALLTERLMKDAPDASRVCGVSMCPKGANCVVKVWLASSGGDAAAEAANMLLPEYRGGVIYTSHMAQIRASGGTGQPAQPAQRRLDPGAGWSRKGPAGRPDAPLFSGRD